MNDLKRGRTRALLAFAGALLFTALGTGPAQAHDSLQSTSPERDTTITAAPDIVTLVLSEPPTDSKSLNLSVITVTDSTGKTLSNGEVTVAGATISTNVTPGSNGPYKVLWRTVSSDGHPIEGTYAFTVEDPAVGAATGPATAAASAPATASAAPSATASSPATTVPNRVPPPNDSNALLMVGIGAIVLVVIGGLVYLSRRKERSGDSDA